MSLIYQSPGWSTHREVALREIDYPLAGDPTHFTVLRTYEGPRASYLPLALDSVDPEFNGFGGKPRAYFVQQGKLEDADGGQVRYTRLFATVPAAHADYIADPYTFPAYIPTTSGSPASITDIDFSGDQVSLVTDLGDVSPGDLVFVSVNYTATYSWGSVKKTIAQYAKILSVDTGGITVHIWGYGDESATDITVNSGTVTKATPGRPYPVTKRVSVRVEYAYMLTDDPDALALPSDFRPIDTGSDNAGGETQKLNTLTIPTSADYLALVTAGARLVIGATKSRYLGNIWRTEIRTVVAQ